jgi:hypothetical protein
MKKKRPRISTTWEEGTILDLWAFVHLISGTVIGILASFSNFSFWVLFFVTLVLMIAWEIFEVIVHIGESFENRIADVVVGGIGFLIAFFVAPEGFGEKLIVLTVLVILLGALEYLGWRAYSERISKQRVV